MSSLSLPTWDEILDMKPQPKKPRRKNSNNNDVDHPSSCAQIHEQAVIVTVLVLLHQTLMMMMNGTSGTAAAAAVHSLLPNPDDIRKVLSRVKANAFSIPNNNNNNDGSSDGGHGRRGNNDDDGGRGGVLGTALFEQPAYLINHSCQPNALQTFELNSSKSSNSSSSSSLLRLGQFPRLVLIPHFKSIAKNEEITISYMDPPPIICVPVVNDNDATNNNNNKDDNDDRRQRQHRENLFQAYHFECSCSHCSSLS